MLLYTRVLRRFYGFTDLLLYTRVLRKIYGFADIHQGFKENFRISCYTQGFEGHFKDFLLYTRVLRKF